ncbi:MAG: hypothetical protein ACJAYE_001322 [Candidatus Azotimanducaceae bacterium]
MYYFNSLLSSFVLDESPTAAAKALLAHQKESYGVVPFFCGILVTTAQMLAGASGPLLDIFYVQSKLSRYETLGTKAITQTLGRFIDVPSR